MTRGRRTAVLCAAVYNSAKSIDALHAKYPNTFFFESESASATSARGAYQDPQWGNTAQDYTPGRREPSSYDNNIVGWASSGEHALKKDRDREYFAGQFIWSGQDCIGEPTPYNNVFPVKTSYSSHVTATLGAASPAPPADATFSGSATTPPEAMTDDDPATGWSNLASKGASLQFPAMTHAHEREWVALNWSGRRSVSSLTARFTTGGALSLPQSVRVTYWDGAQYVPVPDVRITWVATSDAPSTFSFSEVETSRVRLELTSPTPGATTGFFRISELTAQT
ncbi:hypothetical protein [Streptomyces sp. NPDC001315]|uniref:hypothetical protein n=1 Tax=Streptomyces sp. NPDC001315 TaxID=3364562 RepID=UPI0036B33A2D